MNATRLFLVSSIVSALFIPSIGQAQQRPFRFDRDRRFDWDARRIHPWSPYGGNPYNPVMTSSMRTVYMPIIQSAYQPEDSSLQTQYGTNNAAAPDGAMFLSSVGQWVGLPQPSGPLKAPPPGAAIIQVRVPAAFAQVLFDGRPTSTDGTNRYFVTPELPEGKTYTYSLSALWKNGGDDVTKERTIEVKAGNTTVVDFTRPDEK